MELAINWKKSVPKPKPLKYLELEYLLGEIKVDELFT